MRSPESLLLWHVIIGALAAAGFAASDQFTKGVRASMADFALQGRSRRWSVTVIATATCVVSLTLVALWPLISPIMIIGGLLSGGPKR